MAPLRSLALIFISLTFSQASYAGLCLAGASCGDGSEPIFGSPSPGASKTDRIRVNPSAVPTEKVIGVETIFYDSDFDFGFVKGFGRVGAAISPSNNEQTFFGAPGIETPADIYNRMNDAKKYEDPKYTFATAFNLYQNRKSGLKRVSLNLGAMAKYNAETKKVKPGGGLSAVGGPFTVGYSIYDDETQVDGSAYGIDGTHVFKYRVETFSAGITLESFLIDYSTLRSVGGDVVTVNVLSASLLLKRVILTAAQRIEKSERPAFDFKKRRLLYMPEKEEYFGGIQVRANSNLMFGVFYNYYLLRELSLGATLFF